MFLAINASLRWLNNVSGLYLVQVSLLLIGRQGLVDFFRYRLLVPIGWRIAQFLCLRRRNHDQYSANPSLSAIQALSQFTFINEQLYFTCDKQELQN
jgi:hypothetical protein